MKLTKEQIQQKSQEKVKAIQTLANQLQLVVSAEQMITEQGFIKLVVYYTDTEKYDVDQPVTIKEDEIKPIEGETSEGETSESKPTENS
jgi:hypothetical protein